MKQYNSHEAIFLLESFITQRNNRLTDAFIQQMLSKRKDTVMSPQEAWKDNREADSELIYYFSQGLIGTPPEVTELHKTHCINSGIEFCNCLVKEPLQGTTEPF